MTDEQITTIITGVLEGGGILILLYFIIKGLKKNISSLNSTIDMQSKTLEVMEKRLHETKGIGQLYKDLLKEIPEDIRKYKDFIRESKDSLIDELQHSIEKKDEKHKKELENSLIKIHEQEKSINDLIKARNSLIMADKKINSGMESISNYYLKNNLDEKLSDLKSLRIYIQHKGELKINSKNIEEVKLISNSTNRNSKDSTVINPENVSRV